MGTFGSASEMDRPRIGARTRPPGEIAAIPCPGRAQDRPRRRAAPGPASRRGGRPRYPSPPGGQRRADPRPGFPATRSAPPSRTPAPGPPGISPVTRSSARRTPAGRATPPGARAGLQAPPRRAPGAGGGPPSHSERPTTILADLGQRYAMRARGEAAASLLTDACANIPGPPDSDRIGLFLWRFAPGQAGRGPGRGAAGERPRGALRPCRRGGARPKGRGGGRCLGPPRHRPRLWRACGSRSRKPPSRPFDLIRRIVAGLDHAGLAVETPGGAGSAPSPAKAIEAQGGRRGRSAGACEDSIRGHLRA